MFWFHILINECHQSARVLYAMLPVNFGKASLSDNFGGSTTGWTPCKVFSSVLNMFKNLGCELWMAARQIRNAETRQPGLVSQTGSAGSVTRTVPAVVAVRL
jgi:hypothetical protein